MKEPIDPFDASSGWNHNAVVLQICTSKFQPDANEFGVDHTRRKSLAVGALSEAFLNANPGRPKQATSDAKTLCDVSYSQE